MRNLILLSFILIFASSAIASQDISSTSLDLRTVSFEKNSNGIRVSLDVVTLNQAELLNDYSSSLDNLAPEISEYGFWPSTGRYFRLPASGGAHLTLENFDFDLIDDEDLYLNLSGELENWYGTLPADNAWYPENPVSLSEPSILHDFRVAGLTAHAFQVNPALRQVRRISNLNLNINFDDSSYDNTLPSVPTRISEAFLPWYRQLLDWNESELDDFEVYRGKVQVIIQNTGAIMNAFNPWIEWKEQKGWELEFITPDDVTSWSRNEILAELVSRYNSSEPKFDYVVIVGDATGSIYVPPGYPQGPVYGAGDHDYSCLAGDDDLLDVIVGRISVESNQQLAAYVNKVIAYERDPNMGSTDWYSRGSVAAGSESSGISTVFTCEYAKQAMLDAGYSHVSSAYYNDGAGDVNTRTRNTINQGVSFHLYRGYLGSGLSNGEISNLNNSGKTPVVIDITCGRGNWADDTGNNEAWMRAGSATSFKGAIGAISTATSGTHTRFNNSLAGGGVFSVFVLKQKTLGSMLMGAKLNMWKNLAGYQTQVASFNEWLNLMGDPTVWIWTDVPEELIVDAPPYIPIGRNGYEVDVYDQSGPLSGAWVTLFKSDNDEEFIARGQTDSDGSVLLSTDIDFSGEAILTVTAQNCQPVQQTISVLAPDNLLGYSSISIIDDGSVGTNGNGNGIPENGETVGLMITLKNYGQNQENNISVTASSDDDYVESVSGNPTLNSLSPSNETQLNDPILVEIDPEIPEMWNIAIELSFTGSLETYNDLYSLSVSSSRLIFSNSIISANFGPGENGTVQIQLANTGRFASTQAALTLTSNSEWLNIGNANGSLDALNSGSQGTSSSFNISAVETAFRGYPAPATLLVEENNGRIHEINVTIPVGFKSSQDPAGPDAYGYYAFESSDLDYLLRPSYNWIEINPEMPAPDYNGTRLNLPDNSNNGDRSTVVDLPFDFSYYGQTYTQITVCSNGWIAMGDQSSNALGRNWIIPSPLGPSNMIAPLWDDRMVPSSSHSGGVFAFTSADEGIAIIEWDRVTDAANSSPCKFQVILYEQSDVSPTPTGDNEFVFQYEVINASTGGHSGVPYYTAGIENSDQTDGILLAYYNNPAPGSSEIVNNTAILFTTRTSQASGTIYGQVTHADDNSPIEGVRVSASGISTLDYTDSDGNYEINLLPGNVSVTFSRSGYQDVVETNITVQSDQSVELDAQMQRPDFIINPSQINVYVPPGQLGSEQFMATNFSNSAINYDSEILFSGSGPGSEIGSIIETIDVPDWLGEYRCVDVVVYDDFIWVLYDNWMDSAWIDKIDLDGEILQTYSFNLSRPFSLQIYNDQFVIVGNNTIYFYDYDLNSGFTQASTQTFSTNLMEGAGVWYDPINEHLYQAEWIEVTKYSLNGQLLADVTLDIGGEEIFITDIQFVENDPDGYNVHISANAFSMTGTLDLRVYRVDMDSEQVESYFTSQISGWMGVEAFHIHNGVHSMDDEFTTVRISEMGMGLFLDTHTYFTNTDWVNINPASASVPAGEEATITLNIDGTEMTEGDIYEISLSFDVTSSNDPIVVPVTIIAGTNDAPQNQNEIPKDWSIDSVWPNPFNPTTNIKFSLLTQADVKLQMYNILGQQVMEVINQPMNAGVHTVKIDGTQLSSGVYFLQLNAGPLHDVRKIILMK